MASNERHIGGVAHALGGSAKRRMVECVWRKAARELRDSCPKMVLQDSSGFDIVPANAGGETDDCSHLLGVQEHRIAYAQPSYRAQEAGLVKLVEGPQPWLSLWLWHKERTTALLEKAGFEAGEKGGMDDDGDVEAHIRRDGVVNMEGDL